MPKYYIIILFLFVFNENIKAGEPILLKNANELIGEQTDFTNKRTLVGNVILQQRNVIVTSNSAIQYINANKFLLIGNVVVTQDSLILKSESILYDGNTYIATSDKQVNITDGKKTLIGDKGTYSTQTLIANFYDNVKLEDDSLIVYANNITYNRKTTESFANGDVTVKSKFQNIFAQADTIFNYTKTNSTFAKSNSVLFQIDTIKSDSTNDSLNLDTKLNFDTLSIKSDSILAEQNENIYYFYDNVEIVKTGLKAKSQQGIYDKTNEIITLYNPNAELKTHSIVWLDSTQLHADSIKVELKNNKIQKIYAYNLQKSGKCICISQNDTSNDKRIDQLTGDQIIIHIQNDKLNKIESIANAQSIFFSKSNDEPDGVIEASAENIIIYVKDGKAEEVFYVKSIPGKYHPEPFVNGKELEFYLPNFVKDDNKPLQPIIKNRK